ncbi:MAG: DUF1631 family protein [Halioglobus sp.]|nr:DUF1631 family protein [Halioglobus sp.]
MKLTSEHFPISCSLQQPVQEAFAGAAGADDNPTMQLEELLGYLRNPKDLDLTPYADLLGQTEQMGDPALPSQEQTATLRWIGEAVHQFEKRFPLEEPLASQVRRLKPLAASIALVEPDFHQPDAHPLHQLLDSIQERAVGWQSRLGRAGMVLEKQVSAAVEAALQWFDDQSVDLTAICAEFLANAERDQSRAQRMSRRVVETELGRIKTRTAKHDAAGMINELLQKYAAPPEITSFLKGPWYESAQLLLLKFGTDSEQWRQMSEVTATLLDSVQSLEGADEERRQHIFGVVTQLPKEMRRWLLSLHHDTDAVNDAMALVEFAHLKILRQQTVRLEWIMPIEVEAEAAHPARPELAQALKPISEGSWFGIESAREGSVRAQLVLKDEREQRLLFTNLAGLKVLEYSFEEFDELIEKQRITALPTGAGFSLCLAIAAGVDTTEKLNDLYANIPGSSAPVIAEDAAASGTAVHETAAAPAPEDSPATPPPVDSAAGTSVPDDSAGDDGLPADDELRELEALIGDEEPSVEDLDIGFPDPSPPADTRTGSAGGDSGASTPEPASTATNVGATEADEEIDAWLEAQIEAGEDTEQAPPAEAAGEDNARDESSEWLQPPEPPQSPPVPERDTASTAAGGSGDAGADGWLQPTDVPPPQTSIPSATQSATVQSLDLPMGAWLGFHDGDTPLMAKLAVHDPDEDIYIFVNRKGIKMRQVSGAELRNLTERGMVEVLQTASSFREQIEEVRKKLDS